MAEGEAMMRWVLAALVLYAMLAGNSVSAFEFTNVGYVDDGGFAREMYYDGTYIYLANNEDGIRAYTFDGATFTNVGYIDDDGYATDICGDGTYLYVANSGSDIIAYSFDGSTFTRLDSIDHGGNSYSRGIWCDGMYIYVATGVTGSGGYLRAYSFDGTNLTHIDGIFAGDTAFKVWGDGTYIYLANNFNGLRAYTFNGTAFTYLNGIYDGGGYSVVSDVWGDGTYIYAAKNTDGLRAYTFDGVAFTNVGHAYTGSQIISVWGIGAYMYTGGYSDGLRAFTFNGTVFTNVGHINDGVNVRGTCGDGTYIYSATGNGGVYAYSIYTAYILLYDDNENYVKNAKVAIYDTTANEYIYKWKVNVDGIVVVARAQPNSTLLITIKTFDGVFAHNINIADGDIITLTIPIMYNIMIHPVDNAAMPIPGVFAGLIEYTPINPLSFWGVSMYGRTTVPVGGCSGFAICDIFAEKPGYADYEVTALNWTSKSAMVKDYRHTVTMGVGW